MARVLTLSKTFPSYPPKRRQLTGFKEAYLNKTKLHTVRFGLHHDEDRDIREWSGLPYKSPQEKIDQTEVSNFHVMVSFDGLTLKVSRDKCIFFECSRLEVAFNLIDSQSMRFAANDGLSVMDFFDWFVPYGKTNAFKKEETIIVWDPTCAMMYSQMINKFKA